MAAVPTNAVKVVIRTQQGWSSLIKPYIFSTLAIGASVTTGDFICQYLERNKENTGGNNSVTSSPSLLPWWNRQRSSIMCTSAVLVTTPWSFALSRIVERLFPG
ncbi:unnamed protein product [Rotaria sp. Silwood1]|nr:unnamed protein product [Rotaria sp. Silwood1]